MASFQGYGRSFEGTGRTACISAAAWTRGSPLCRAGLSYKPFDFARRLGQSHSARPNKGTPHVVLRSCSCICLQCLASHRFGKDALKSVLQTCNRSDVSICNVKVARLVLIEA